MRRHLFFISTIVLMIGAIITFSLTLREQNLLYFHGEKQAAQDFLKELQKTHRPLTELNLTAMYGGSGQFQILHPVLAMKSLYLNIPKSGCAQVDIQDPKTSESLSLCDLSSSSNTFQLSDPKGWATVKQRDYLRILRGELGPSDFILTPPFTDAFGISYAYLLVRNDIPPFNTLDWIRGHLSFFRTTELKDIFKRFKIEDPTYEALSRLTESEIRNLVEGSPVLLTPDYILLKNEARLGFSPLSYWVYDIHDLRTQLQNHEYDLVTDSANTYCLERVGNACWTYSSKTMMSTVFKYSISILIFAGLIFLILIVLYGRYVADKNQERRKHQLSLQVLSHEFRTPVSALLLLLEEFSRDLTRLDESDQDRITKISSEAFRLQRIIEMSKTYLQSASTSTRFNFVLIPSINSWIEDFAQDFDSRIQCELLMQDQSVEADSFWLRFVLSNLVQNAFAHGKEPVHIRLFTKNGKIHISVEDEGACEFDSLKKMSEAFVKSHKSRGMGLGLNITSAIVKEWGGELKFKNSPTSFSIAFQPTPTKGPEIWQ